MSQTSPVRTSARAGVGQGGHEARRRRRRAWRARARRPSRSARGLGGEELGDHPPGRERGEPGRQRHVALDAQDPDAGDLGAGRRCRCRRPRRRARAPRAARGSARTAPRSSATTRSTSRASARRVAVVLDHPRRRGALVGERGLRREPRPGLLLGERVAPRRPRALHVGATPRPRSARRAPGARGSRRGAPPRRARHPRRRRPTSRSRPRSRAAIRGCVDAVPGPRARPDRRTRSPRAACGRAGPRA